ncbi:maltase A1-like [Toxorhynchites rutilus septentrionalis]|uniref:maltase A1-like n=1 Tax=Toxorhynchites rutilus septentrionalis TaxID=329112 RepID=UPI00247A9B58|nr:maltase A1-like [Toxorhynchites rutilus septentrionalis]
MASALNCWIICSAMLLLQSGGLFSEKLRTLKVSDWWGKAGFYQIYPRSFKDSNGDGVGDLNGITEKLPYLKSIGVKAFWLSPIYKSPMADFGYDISDFRDIQPEYGTMTDFDRMVTRAKALGLKIILDFVPNHSSDEHEWFLKSENRTAGYEDYYVWHDGIPGNNPLQNDPPNNWVENFRGSAWRWSAKRKQYYLHQFHYKQPDLNYRNEKVVNEMKDVLRFWLGKGVDGFRVDAVPWLFEVADFRNEPVSNLTSNPLSPEYLVHIYTQDLPETVDMVYQWREVMDDYKTKNGGDTRLLMTEAWSNLSVVANYFQDSNKKQGSHMPFNFQLILRLNQMSKAADFKTVIDSWLDIVPGGHTPNWVLGNHDRRRVASRMGGEHMVDLMAMVELTMPGVSVTYQGEELGMTDANLSWEQTKDPAACQTSEAEYTKYTRDPSRTPFHWGNSSLAGFTNGTKTWLPVAANYQTVNVQAEQTASKSHLKVFQELMKLRDSSDFYENQYGTVVLGTNVLAIVRVDCKGVYVTLLNIANATETINAEEAITRLNITKTYEKSRVLVASVSSKRSIGDTLQLHEVVLQPYEGLVLRSGATLLFARVLYILATITIQRLFS